MQKQHHVLKLANIENFRSLLKIHKNRKNFVVYSIDPFPDLLHYRLFPCHGGHFGGHNCIGAFG